MHSLHVNHKSLASVTTAFWGVRPSGPAFLQLSNRYRRLSIYTHRSRYLHCSIAEMKRKDPRTKAQQQAKKTRVEVPEYHLTPSVLGEDGSIQWPAPKRQIERAREIIREWHVFPVSFEDAKLTDVQCSVWQANIDRTRQGRRRPLFWRHSQTHVKASRPPSGMH